MPLDQARAWAGSEQVTIDAAQVIEPGKKLQILIEKDFQCMHSRAEGDDDAFPNPRDHSGIDVADALAVSGGANRARSSAV